MWYASGTPSAWYKKNSLADVMAHVLILYYPTPPVGTEIDKSQPAKFKMFAIRRIGAA